MKALDAPQGGLEHTLESLYQAYKAEEDAKFCDRCRFVLSTFWRNLEPFRNLRLELERCLAERSRAEQQLGEAQVKMSEAKALL